MGRSAGDHSPLQVVNGAERADPRGQKSAWYWDGDTFVLDMVAGTPTTDDSTAFIVRALAAGQQPTNVFEVLKNGVIKILDTVVTFLTFGNVTSQTSYGASSSNGVATSASRSDHVHGTPSLSTNVASTQAFGDTATNGSGTAPAKDDHKHAMPANPVSFATPGLTLGTANAAGAASTVIRSDATILAFDATTPASVGTAAVGAATVAARRDHVHATGAGTPTTQAFGDSAATGTGPAAAMTDHKHAMPAAPVTSLTASSPLSRDVSTGSVTVSISAASTSAAGSMSSADKQLLTQQGVTGGTVTVDFSAGATYVLTTNANAAFTLTNGQTNQWHAIVIKYGGTHTVTFSTTVNWAGGTTPTWTSTNAKTDIVSLFYDGSKWYGDASVNHAQS